ncbi:Outer membrane protein assembly factor BamA [Pustulibacterium marinum]|uniref:Outer membrane protein assembly factor BamA n=1 Tax=Pustulibacterium marinum TaxID=1224947 RepID=A0A1I7GBT0_9FLAO|nr:BamA/TamA family outer membrane protein [Pustulibacterium marinum]SFU45932.1 Outer membrane protein assembly factor BamA [Pustulibacterium marinum]
MNKRHIYHIGILVGSLWVLYSCAVDKYIPDNEQLYTGAEVTIEKDSVSNEIEDLPEIQTTLEGVLKPEPNTSILGLRPGLHYYYKAQSKEKPGFILRWLNKKYGEEPVYASDVDLTTTENLIKNRLENRGFFQSQISSSLTTNDTTQRGSASYSVKLSTPYTMVNYKLDKDSFPVYEAIKSTMNRPFLREGIRFDLDRMKAERERIDFLLKRKGYYNFNSDFLIFEADTNVYDNKSFDLYLTFKDNVPAKAKIPYKLRQIYVYPNSSASDKEVVYDTVTINNIHFLQDTLYFKPKLLAPYILFKDGQYYNPERSSNTSRRLGSIGNYKFVNIRYKEIDSLQTDSLAYLDTHIYLSPLNKQAVRAELQGVSKSNGFTGPNLALTYSNRNIFKGGEILKISGKVGYETQIASGQDAGLTSTLLGLQADFIYPRMLFPMDLNAKFSYSIPKTTISVAGNYLSRGDLYTLTSANTSFGYTWNANKYVTHTLKPIDISYLKLGNTTEEFEAILDENAYLRRSFEQQFIPGINYQFIYNEMGVSRKKTTFYTEFGFDTAGNTLGLFGNGNSENPDTFLGLEYAQYARFEADLRMHYNIDRKNMIAMRLYGGYGLPYGNSDILPFTKQFFSGGPYSVRAFRIRSLGPGSYNPDYDYDNATASDNTSYFDQSGDIKLEANIEYRYPIFSYLKGAVFADAGNVWLKNDNEALPGGKFSSNFLNEIGVGIGTGLRIDIQSFVIRFDLATPIKKPYYGDNDWNAEFKTFVFNFAIGYPF